MDAQDRNLESEEGDEEERRVPEDEEHIGDCKVSSLDDERIALSKVGCSNPGTEDKRVGCLEEDEDC